MNWQIEHDKARLQLNLSEEQEREVTGLGLNDFGFPTVPSLRDRVWMLWAILIWTRLKEERRPS